MTPTNLEELKRAAEAATRIAPGEWEFDAARAHFQSHEASDG